jgi:hypothetical protein
MGKGKLTAIVEVPDAMVRDLFQVAESVCADDLAVTGDTTVPLMNAFQKDPRAMEQALRLAAHVLQGLRREHLRDRIEGKVDPECSAVDPLPRAAACVLRTAPAAVAFSERTVVDGTQPIRPPAIHSSQSGAE